MCFSSPKNLLEDLVLKSMSSQHPCLCKLSTITSIPQTKRLNLHCFCNSTSFTGHYGTAAIWDISQHKDNLWFVNYAALS